MGVNEVAARGYEVSSDAYESGRPDYPVPAIDYLLRNLQVHAGTKALELGAGTGKFTKLLASSGASLFAVEPVEAMRRKLTKNVPGVTVLDGTAESIPLAAGAVSTVVVAQAFHWFDGIRALEEIHRVLRPGGRLGLVWNVRDESVDWVAQLTNLIDPHEGGAPRYRTGRWRAAFDVGSLFTPLTVEQFRHVHRGPPQMVVDRVASISFVAALSDAAREQLLNEVRGLLASHPDTRGSAEIAFPYRTDAFVCARNT